MEIQDLREPVRNLPPFLDFTWVGKEIVAGYKTIKSEDFNVIVGIVVGCLVGFAILSIIALAM